MIFVVLTCVIFLSAYLAYMYVANIFQVYVYDEHLSAIFIPSANIRAQRLSLLVFILCMLKSLQNLERQRWLMLISMACLIIAVAIPTTVKSYPFIPGFSSVVLDLTEPWRQLFVPPAWRATIEGITEGLTGFIDISSIMTENHLIYRLFHYNHHAGIIYTLILAALFAKLTQKLDGDSLEIKQKPKSIKSLFTEYPYIFILALFSGLNTGIFSYTYILAKEALPTLPAQYYQSCIYAGSIFGPMIVGRIADKKGIFLTIVWVGALMVPVKILSASFFLMQLSSSVIYYIPAGLEGALAVSLWTLSLSLVGERLRIYGIFRAFALSNLTFSIGMLMASRFYEFFIASFFQTKLMMGFADLFIIGLLIYFYKKYSKIDKNA